jgi:hypothetical protein
MRTAGALIATVLLAGSLGGCASGDFGRTRSTFLSDDEHNWLGPEATGSVGKPASNFQLTDDEHRLRDLAYPFIEPPHSRPAWKAVFGDYLPLSSPWNQKAAFDRTAYGKLLIDEYHRSYSSRYAQLIDDIRDDITRLDPFFSVAAQVIDLDGKRRASLSMISDVSSREYKDALARINENALIVQWVQQCIQQRISSYRWALERMVLLAPDPVAADAERTLNLLVQQAADPRYNVVRTGGVALVSKG